MKQAVFNRFGMPSKVIECINVPDLKPPNDWEVTVDIMVATVNPSDVSVLRGHYGTLPSKFPATTGLEASGRVAAVGRMVKDFAVGDRVILVANNNWVQRRNIAASALQKIPDWLSYEQAAMVKVNAFCAQLMLTSFGDLQPGDYVIQNAPMSAVGQMIMVFAAAKGIKTINVIRKEKTSDDIKKFGGDIAVLDGEVLGTRVSKLTGGTPISVGLDAVAGDAVSRMADCLEDGATLVNYGMLSGQDCQLRPDQTIFRDIRLRGFWLRKVLSTKNLKERQAMFEDTFSIMEKKKVEFTVFDRYPIEQISTAIEASESEDRRGKVLILPNGEC